MQIKLNGKVLLALRLLTKTLLCSFLGHKELGFNSPVKIKEKDSLVICLLRIFT